MTSSWVLAAKATGAFLVVTAGCMIGFGHASRLEEELKEMQRLESFLIGLISDISYALLPLPRALVQNGQRVGGAIGSSFAALGRAAGMENRATLGEALAQMTSDERGEACVSRPLPFHASLMSDLVRVLGTSGHKEQIAHVQHALDTAKNYRLEREHEYRNRARVSRYLGVLGSLGAVITFL